MVGHSLPSQVHFESKATASPLREQFFVTSISLIYSGLKVVELKRGFLTRVSGDGSYAYKGQTESGC